MWPNDTCSASSPRTKLALWMVERWQLYLRAVAKSWAGVSDVKSTGAPPVQRVFIRVAVGCVPGERGISSCRPRVAR
jgi:hypothetical protein